MDKILFYLNIPAELTFSHNPKLFIIVEARRFSSEKVGIEFLGIDTMLAMRITDWRALYGVAEKLAQKKFEAADDGKELIDETYLNEL